MVFVILMVDIIHTYKISTIFGKTRKIRGLTYQKKADFAWYAEHETDVSMAVDKHVVHHVSKNSFLCGR